MPSIERKFPITAISVAAPAYNEAANISGVVEEWLHYLKNLPGLSEFEIVICNDGSSDQTGKLIDQLAAGQQHLRPVHHIKNQGAAAALATAIKNTRFAWVFLIDSDGQYKIENLERFIAAVEKSGLKAAIGMRTRKHDSALARFGSWSSGCLCNLFHGTNYRDFNCALKLVDGHLLRSLTLEAKGLNYSAEVTSKLIERRIEMVEIEVEHHPRASGRSSAQSVKAAWHRLLFVLYIGFRQLLIRSKILRISDPGD